MIKCALAGNPNSGKTTLFNSLTGSTAHVGNWAGVTVDKREGQYKKFEEEVYIVDLPGIYSLSPYTAEEVVSRNFLIDEKPDVVIDVIDATNIERNLYLTTQLLEIDVPIVIAINMCDVIRKNGGLIKVEEIAKTLGVPVVEISALKEEGLDELMKAAYEVSKKPRKAFTVLRHQELVNLISEVEAKLEGKVGNPLFHAVKMVELDELEVQNHSELVELVEKSKETFEDDLFQKDFQALIADSRYKFITEKFKEIYVKKNQNEGVNLDEELTRSEKIDKVLTHKIFSFPIFILIMFLMFHFTFSEDLFFMGAMGLKINNQGFINFLTGMGYGGSALSGIPSLGVFMQNWVGFACNKVIEFFGSFLPSTSWYGSLFVDGILSGVGAVLSFIPQILLLFFFIAILEDSGYMARIAFILDRAFRKSGLSGKAFIPMLTGFGCSVPAIMATRTLGNDSEKKRIIKLITCFSCGAKAPIWALLASIGSFVGASGDLFVFSIYLGGIALAVIFALLLKLFTKDQYVSPFIMELPSYHLPQARNVAALLWDKLKHYLLKAGTIILGCTVVIWFLSNFGWNFWKYNAFSASDFDMKWSIIGTLGQGLRYLFYPLGCLDGGWTYATDGWKYCVSTLTGLIAKEDVVATLAVLGLDSSTITLSIPGALSFAFFNLLTIPCVSAIAAASGELKFKDLMGTILFWFGISYATSLAIYWIGNLYLVNWVSGLLLTLGLVFIIVLIGFIVSRRNKRMEALD